MNRRRFINTFTAMAAAMPLAGCFNDTYTWRQKITIVVSTPDGDKTGAAVTQVAYWPNRFSLLFGGEWVYGFIGEAAFVEFKPGRCLFVLLTHLGGDHADSVMRETMGVSRTHKGFQSIVDDREVRSISFERSPSIFVCDTGNQPNDSNAEFFESLAVTKLETGYQVKSLTIRVTEEPRTIGTVKSVLPWIGQGYDSNSFSALDKNVQKSLNGLATSRNWN
jgi:hypothetical protein